MLYVEKRFLRYTEFRPIIFNFSGKEIIMSTLAERIVRLLEHNPGLTDREITDSLRGYSEPQQPINQKCHALKNRGVLVRHTRPDGLIGNYLASHGNVVHL
jgi:hypothetical protein